MSKSVIVESKIKSFKKTIRVSGDKSISIRWVLFSSLASGVSTAKNLLISEDVIASINAIKKLGIKVNLNKKQLNALVSKLNLPTTKPKDTAKIHNGEGWLKPFGSSDSRLSFPQ